MPTFAFVFKTLLFKLFSYFAILALFSPTAPFKEFVVSFGNLFYR
jgi:hypothetical protein